MYKCISKYKFTQLINNITTLYANIRCLPSLVRLFACRSFSSIEDLYFTNQW